MGKYLVGAVALAATLMRGQSASADVPDSGTCLAVQMFGGLPVVEASDGRITDAVAAVLAKAAPTVAVHVCELVDLSYGPIVMTHKILTPETGEVSMAIIIVSRLAAEQYSAASLEAIIAHEIAHTKITSEPQCTMAAGEHLPNIALRLSCEIPVDALAATWVGVDVMQATLRDVERVIIPYVKLEHQDYTHAEIAGRIAALDKSRT